MPLSLLQADRIIDQLVRAPMEIRVIVDQLTTWQLRVSHAPGEWSVAEVLAHLRACADMWGGRRIMAMLSEEHPIIKAISPRTWVHQTDYLKIDVQASLTAYSAQRAELLRILHSFPGDAWLRSATCTGAGKRFETTVHNEGDAIARHEAAHTRQMERVARSLLSMEPE